MISESINQIYLVYVERKQNLDKNQKKKEGNISAICVICGEITIKRSRKKFTFIMLSDSNFLSEAKKLNKNFRVVSVFHVLKKLYRTHVKIVDNF